MEIYSKIRKVAIYSRKSRNDTGTEFDVLEKHRAILIDFVMKYGWEYCLFEEIGTSYTVEFRPEFKRMLTDISLGIFDAVVVLHYDRISRGSTNEYEFIKSIFKQSNILFLTPYGEIINFHENSINTDSQAVFSHYELQRTRERLLTGKIQGAKQGHLVMNTILSLRNYNHPLKNLKYISASFMNI
ncbi:recombinase family protein [Bacillus sp. DX1.1]|uniref:recombinase family protein n=1 Tax=unclassified Bacillus (in: firmicutes) TaxID=185979 RepID=UPI00257120BE|nr:MULTISPECIES: recombinase family protein [unclassified Bacillus (in: firmicutes)]MDM5155670.1 recombinase family protein [Bacillus sp. DX1.1]WJE79974.1 recombinase family protein [Bacillus sp. DX3.1]